MQLAPSLVAMKAIGAKYLLPVLLALLFLFPAQSGASAGMKSTFQYSLSNLYGKYPFNEAKVRVDRIRDEVYVIDGGTIRVFNNVGMEVYSFGDDPELGTIYDLAIDEKGDIFLLSYDLSDALAPKYSIIRCNYRGDIREKLQVSELPSGYPAFGPNAMVYRDGSLFLVNMNQARAIVTDRNGVFRRDYEFLKIIELPEKERSDKELFGFSIDPAGNLLFTIPVLFKAYVVSPEGSLIASFGKAGSAPGMFGVVSGIAMDDLGNYLVVERLRSVVMVFDKDFQFLTEFGYRGTAPASLIQPNDLAVGNSGKLYVNQVRNRGVSVFTLVSESPKE